MPRPSWTFDEFTLSEKTTLTPRNVWKNIKDDKLNIMHLTTRIKIPIIMYIKLHYNLIVHEKLPIFVYYPIVLNI